MRADTPWELFRRTAVSTPGTEAIVDADRNERLDYGEFHDHVRGLAGALADRDIARATPSPPCCEAGSNSRPRSSARAHSGQVCNTVNYRQSADAVSYIVTDSDARVLVFGEANRETVAAIRGDLDRVEIETCLYAGETSPDWADPPVGRRSTSLETRAVVTGPPPDGAHLHEVDRRGRDRSHEPLGSEGSGPFDVIAYVYGRWVTAEPKGRSGRL